MCLQSDYAAARAVRFEIASERFCWTKLCQFMRSWIWHSLYACISFVAKLTKKRIELKRVRTEAAREKLAMLALVRISFSAKVPQLVSQTPTWRLGIAASDASQADAIKFLDDGGKFAIFDATNSTLASSATF